MDGGHRCSKKRLSRDTVLPDQGQFRLEFDNSSPLFSRLTVRVCLFIYGKFCDNDDIDTEERKSSWYRQLVRVAR